MKLNITVDLQDIFDSQSETAYYEGSEGRSDCEGYDLNQSIKNEVIGAILDKVSKDCISAVMKEANKKVDVALTDAVNKAVAAIGQKSVDYATDWLENKNIKITNNWGRSEKTTSIQEIIEESFTKTLERKVDGSGNFTDSYNAHTRLIDYVSDKHIQDCVSKRLPDMNYKLDKAINEVLEKKTTELLAEKLNKVVK